MKDWLKIEGIFNLFNGEFQFPFDDEKWDEFNVYISKKMDEFTHFMKEVIVITLQNDSEQRTAYFNSSDKNKYPIYQSFLNEAIYKDVIQHLDITSEELPYEDYLKVMESNMPAYAFTRIAREWLIDNDIAITTAFQAFVISHFDSVGTTFAMMLQQEVRDAIVGQYPEEADAAQKRWMDEMMNKQFGDKEKESDVNNNTVKEIIEEAKKNSGSSH